MDRIRKIKHKDKDILMIDYSNCDENEMIDIINKARDLILEHKAKVLTLSIFNGRNRGTPNFVRHVERELPKYEHLVEKQVVTGLNQIQIWILKGVNLWTKKKLLHFNSIDDAMEFLVK